MTINKALISQDNKNKFYTKNNNHFEFIRITVHELTEIKFFNIFYV